MGTYLTSTDFDGGKIIPADELIQLTDDEGVNQIGTAVLNEAILQAEGILHSYLGRRYTVPVDLTDFADVAATVRMHLVALVSYLLQSPPRRPRTPEDVRRKYEDAIAWLKDAAAGKVSLGVDPAPSAGTSAEGGSYGGEHRRMKRHDLNGL